MKPHTINTHSIEWQVEGHEDFSHFRKRLTPLVIGEKLGASLYKLMPGKKTFPYHFHYANEEAIFILEGNGTVRLNNEMIAIHQGDYMVFPVGSEHAHQIINTSNEPLVFLCFSTMHHPEISEYPDSNKIGVFAGVAPGAPSDNVKLKGYYHKNDKVPYFDGEK